MVSRGPWVWVQLGGPGPRGLPGPHPHSRAPVPSPRPEWVQAGDPAQDLAELPLRLLLARQPRPRSPFLSAERGGSGGGRGERQSQQTQGVLPALLTL